MMKVFVYILVLFFACNLFSQEPISDFTSSTEFTSELSGIVKNKTLEPIEVLTSQEIKLLGVENIPDLLKYISGVNVYKVNNSSIDFSLRGLPGFFRIQPLILIDGMEYSQNLYDKVFFYNFPVNIDDIDRVEIIKDPTKFINGIESPGGIINIVTKRPELLSSNYFNIYNGSNRLVDTNFSINRYFKGLYYKITGEFRKIDKYHSKKRAISKKFITFSSSNFFESSKLFTKLSLFKVDYSFTDFYRMKLNNLTMGSPVDFKFKDENLVNFIIDYTSSNFNINFYTQAITGKIGSKSLHNFFSEYYKLSLKKYFKKNFLTLIPGIIASYSNSHIATQGSGKRESLILYLNTDLEVFRNIKLSGFIKNQRARNLGNQLSFKTSITYSNEKNNFLIKFGYSKNFRNPSLLSQYYNLKENYNFLGFNLPVIIKANKNLKPVKFYSTFFNISGKINKLVLKCELFYNRITDLFFAEGSLKFFPPSLIGTNKNKLIFTIHGIDSKLEYKINKNFWLQTSYYIQHFNNKTSKIQGNWLIPKYKFMSILFFNSDIISGNVKWTYTPRIKTKCAGKSDYLSIIDLSLIKTFFNKKLETSINIENLFRDNGKEATYGEKLERNFIFKLKYNF